MSREPEPGGKSSNSFTDTRRFGIKHHHQLFMRTWPEERKHNSCHQNNQSGRYSKERSLHLTNTRLSVHV